MEDGDKFHVQSRLVVIVAGVDHVSEAQGIEAEPDCLSWELGSPESAGEAILQQKRVTAMVGVGTRGRPPDLWIVNVAVLILDTNGEPAIDVRLGRGRVDKFQRGSSSTRAFQLGRVEDVGANEAALASDDCKQLVEGDFGKIAEYDSSALVPNRRGGDTLIAGVAALFHFECDCKEGRRVRRGREKGS